jgi:RimJ/RimL family protein N-acetyltransferase
MRIRHTAPADIDAVMRLYERARAFMRENGNASQWGDTHPAAALVREDIARRTSYVCTADYSRAGGEILGVFCFFTGNDPTYHHIEQGNWLNDKPYGVVHRLAAGCDPRAEHAKGAGTFCLEWCLAQCGNIRIDTHKDNTPMRGLLQKLGYTYCGIIHVEDGTSRLAYQKSQSYGSAD